MLFPIRNGLAFFRGSHLQPNFVGRGSPSLQNVQIKNIVLLLQPDPHAHCETHTLKLNLVR